VAKKAFAREDKDGRRRLILATAARLFIEGDGSLPSAAKIAQASDLAKGTVYLYFTTKGAIFAALQAEGWGGLREAVDRVTAGATGSRDDVTSQIIAGLVNYLRAHPELLQLDALGHSVIEPNMTLEELAVFKGNHMTALAASADRLDRALELGPGKGLQMLLRSYALVRGLWQSFPFTAASDAAESASGDFYVELTDALHEYWRGALT
jgi:AcrR family transcriptional regulator